MQRSPQRPSRWPEWARHLTRMGIVSDNPDVIRRQTFANVGSLVVAGNALSHLVMNASYSLWGLMPLHIYNLAIVVIALSLHRLHRFGDNIVAACLCTLIVVGHSFVVFSLGLASDLHIYFALAAFMLVMFGVRNWPIYLAFYVAAFIALLAVLQFGNPLGFLLPGDVSFRAFLSSQAIINVMIINGLGISYILTALNRAQEELAQQVAVSDALVDVMLPKSVSARLKQAEERQIADRVEGATVMFADLSGFTQAAADVSAETLVGYLDEVFTGFDLLCERHGVDKIKTMGDGYMAVGGLSGDAAAGAVATGRLALDMLAFIDGHRPLGDTPLGLRIGLHTGPVIAGVIGDMRVSYDVWGSTVNVAQRMEAHGEAGRIQVSSSFAEMAGAAFAYEPRGALEIKGAGRLETWFLAEAETTTGPEGPAA
ncbi:adenylate/guanylate cyclase domain-containing protein [Devosia sp. SL43]|uniref:adenylate/guanylate cyclase domain-containing protein n=1 Tax=Devosia sp. SL43 TaxID=2806348 RepID=UPI001F3C9878|nr:adenylate/guanylate cyclase domain-containing protein [Devosia sp. SL43]UJW86635.1 adenylate/guanylate cyclase domain-containing protein [Devosia sp. SL43]